MSKHFQIQSIFNLIDEVQTIDEMKLDLIIQNMFIQINQIIKQMKSNLVIEINIDTILKLLIKLVEIDTENDMK